MDERQRWLEEELAKQEDEERRRIRARLSGAEVSPERTAFVRALEEPLAITLQQAHALAAQHAARFSGVACRGDRELVGACFTLTERSCPLRSDPGCPKRVLEFEAERQRLAVRPRTPLEILCARGVPRLIAERVLAGPEDWPAMREVRSWWLSAPRPPILVLIGENQVGKSTAAAMLVHEQRGLFVPMSQVADLFEDKDDTRRMREEPLVVFDDVGDEEDRFRSVRARWASLVCNRIDNGRDTIITTNLATLRPYSDRLAERVNVQGVAIPVGR